MDEALDDLQLNEARSILSFSDDVLVLVVRAAYSVNTLKALANSCSRICALARSSVSVQLRVQDVSSARMLLQLVSSKRPVFSACSDLIAVAQDAQACYELPEVLLVAAELANLRALDLTVAPPQAAAGAAMAGAVLDDFNCGVAGFLWPLKRLQQLQQLKLQVPALGMCGAAFPGELKQLTSLRLAQGRDWDVCFMPPDLSFLEGMSNLVELEVDASSEPRPWAAAAGPYRLPATLRRLQLGSYAVDTADWLQHLSECPQLTELQFDTDGRTYIHPAAVLELAAQNTPGLRRLVCRSHPGAVTDAPWQPVSKEDQEPFSQLEAIAALIALEHLDVNGFLTVDDAEDWQSLGTLTALTRLVGIVVSQAPPQLWQQPCVKHLEARLEDVRGEQAAQLLLAFPAAQLVRLSVTGCYNMPEATGAAGGSRAHQGVPETLTSLTSLQLAYPQLVWDGEPPAGHAAPMLAAASGVVNLSFDNIRGVGANQLPDLSGCTTLTRLQASAYGEEVPAEAVVAMVQPLAPTLRVLELSWMEYISPRAAVALQAVLPHLEHLCFDKCHKVCEEDPSGGTEEEQLAALRQQLRPDLMLTVTHNV
jgi:hypothetical protein